MLNNVKHIIIIGAGFGGMSAAKKLGNKKNIKVTVIDRRNHHLFQPLLYQVAMAELTAGEIATPIRSILSKYKNIDIILGNVVDIDLKKSLVKCEDSEYYFDFLILSCGSTHNYFGKDEWRQYAPGMKSLEQAIEIREKVLISFEYAEREKDPEKIKSLLTFIIIGGGATGVELAGAIAEMSHFTLGHEFHHIDPRKTQIILVEAGQKILPNFEEKQSQYAKNKLEKMGVIVKLNAKVTHISDEGIYIGEELIKSKTIIWAAGVRASKTGKMLDVELDKMGRVKVEDTLNLKDNDNIFVIGDQAHVLDKNKQPLPGLAAVAIQQGFHVAKNILRTIYGQNKIPFTYFNKGQMATIGRKSAIVEIGNFKLEGFFAWILWALVHIMYLVGFRNKLLVFIRWAWVYFTFSRGARLIIDTDNSKND